MTTTYFKVKFSLDEIYVQKAFCGDGGALVLDEWVDDGKGCSFYMTETQAGAKAALGVRITDEIAFLVEAEIKYAT